MLSTYKVYGLGISDVYAVGSRIHSDVTHVNYLLLLDLAT